MKRSLALALFVLAGVGLPSAFALSFSTWVEAEGGWETGAILVEESQRGQRLESQHDAVYRCVGNKGEITKDLLAGRLTLDEAVRRFHESEVCRNEQLGKEPPPLDSAREVVLLKCVINWARAIGRNGEPDQQRMVPVLEAEYRTRLQGSSGAKLNAG
jgi:hypothetical protein